MTFKLQSTISIRDVVITFLVQESKIIITSCFEIIIVAARLWQCNLITAVKFLREKAPVKKLPGLAIVI